MGNSFPTENKSYHIDGQRHPRILVRTDHKIQSSFFTLLEDRGVEISFFQTDDQLLERIINRNDFEVSYCLILVDSDSSRIDKSDSFLKLIRNWSNAEIVVFSYEKESVYKLDQLGSSNLNSVDRSGLFFELLPYLGLCRRMN